MKDFFQSLLSGVERTAGIGVEKSDQGLLKVLVCRAWGTCRGGGADQRDAQLMSAGCSPVSQQAFRRTPRVFWLPFSDTHVPC